MAGLARITGTLLDTRDTAALCTRKQHTIKIVIKNTAAIGILHRNPALHYPYKTIQCNSASNKLLLIIFNVRLYVINCLYVAILYL